MKTRRGFLKALAVLAIAPVAFSIQTTKSIWGAWSPWKKIGDSWSRHREGPRSVNAEGLATIPWELQMIIDIEK